MRKTLVLAVVVLVFAGGAAFAQITDSPKAPTYTGCLRAEDGTIYGVAEGGSPASDCDQDDIELALSSGDITRVTAGHGLLGGGSEGGVTLGVAPSFQLPQQCDGGAVSKWDPEGGAWVCGADVDTTYAAGTGLELDDTNTFHFDGSEVASPGQVHTLWVSPHWQSFVTCRSSGSDRPCFRSAKDQAEVWILNLNGPAAGSGQLDAAIWWMTNEGELQRRDEVTVPGGSRHRGFAPATHVPQSGWVLITASKPVLAGGRQWMEGRNAFYQMPFFPLDCSDGEGLEFICERFGDRLKDKPQ